MNTKSDKGIKSKKEYYNQGFELITIDKGFNEDVDKFRKKWSINVAACKKYYGSRPIISGRQIDVSGYENSLFNNYISYKSPKDKKMKLDNDDKDRYLDYNKDIGELLKKYNLSFRYATPLKTFIYMNEIVEVPSAYVRISYNYHLGYVNSKILEITIYPDSTDADISDIKRRIKQWKAKVSPKNSEIRCRPMDSYNLKKRIWELHNEGKSYPEIAKVIKEEYIKVATKSKDRVTCRYIEKAYAPNPLKGVIDDVGMTYNEVGAYIMDVKERIFGHQKSKNIKCETAKSAKNSI